MEKQPSKLTAPARPDDFAQGVARQALKKMQMTSKWRAADGRDAWSELKRAAYGEDNNRNPRKLTHEEAHKIARQLYDYLEKIEPKLKKLGISKTDLCAPFCNSAHGSIDSKELYRITLPPDADPAKRGIRVSAEKYVQFIEELAFRLNESASLVAEPILRNTPLHPFSRSMEEWTDMEKVQVALQSIVNKIDAEFNLFATYRQTASLKCKDFEKGDRLCWPLYIPLELESGSFDMPTREDYLKAYEIAADESQAFYRRNKYYGKHNEYQGWFLFGFETGALQDDEFFYVPHAPLGEMLLWNLPDRRKNRADYALAVDQQVRETQQGTYSAYTSFIEPQDEWDEEQKAPYGQTSKSTDDVALQYHFWLLAYPHPDGKRLIATLYQPAEEGGAYLLPLDIEGLEMLADAIWISKTSHCTALEQLKRLLLDQGEDGMNSIERSFRRTASWLTENPILKRERARKESSKRLDQFFGN